MGSIGILATFVSILVSFKLSVDIIVLAIGLFLSFIATCIYLALKDFIREHDRELKKINEKINIYRDINELKARMNVFERMRKKANVDTTEILMGVIQI